MQTLDEIKKNVEHPSYYGGADNPYEAIKVLREWQLDKDAYLWNVGKYLSRAGHKDGNSQLQDLTKARWYLDYKIRLLEEQQKIAESVVDTLKKIPDERPIPLKDNVVISDYGLSFIGYYDYNKRDREHFCDANTFEKIYECPSYWLKGLDLHEQEKIANKEYEQRLVARKEAENVFQTVSDADES